jgi:hypothetical protein
VTAILAEDSSPQRCATITIDAPTLAWLLRVPEGHKLDTLSFDGETARLIVSGPDMPAVEPGYPVPRMQLALTVDARGCIVASRLAPINEDLGAIPLQPVEAA